LHATTITNMALQFKVMNMWSMSLATAASEWVMLLCIHYCIHKLDTMPCLRDSCKDALRSVANVICHLPMFGPLTDLDCN